LLSAYSLSYLISIYRRCFCQGVWPVRAVQRAAGATATGPWTAVCVRSMSFSIHFYQTRPHRHACANRQRRNRSGHPPPRASHRRTLHTTHNSTAWRLRRHHCRQSSLRGTIVVSLACGANQVGLSRSAERSLAVAPHARCAPARRATATVARGPPCDSVARGLVLSHLSALAARETKTRQRSSRGHLLHHAGTAGAVGVAQAATRRVVARPSPLRSRLSRSAALPRHERAASSRRRESGDYTPGRRSATAPAVPW
jgi:hypothetical protein